MPEALTEQKVTEFRQKVCEVALRQFSELGTERVSMRSLARAMGYSATALYSYYKNKDDILAAVRTIHVDKLATDLEQALSNATPEEQSRAFIGAYVAFVSAEPTACKLAFALEQPAPTDYPALAGALSRLDRTFTRLSQAVSGTPLSQPQAEQQGQLLWAAFHGVMALHLAGIATRSQKEAHSLHSQLLESLSKMTESGQEAAESAKKRVEQMALDL
ncbi:MAG: TetR/AcrR family transcriptional regulator [Porticoccaceae bacterium]